MTATTKLSAKEAAQEIGTDPRTLRKFIRASAEKGTLPIAPCGQGNRYEFTKSDVKALKKAFVTWSASTGEKAPKPKTEKRAAEPETEDIVDELTGDLIEQDEIDRTVEEVDLTEDGDPVEFDDTDFEPSDEDLIDIEDLDLDIEID